MHLLDRRTICRGKHLGDLEELYVSMRCSITNVVARIVPPDDVEDIVQETYLRLSRVAIATEIKHPRSYIYQTARNLALDSLKKADNARTSSWNEFHDRLCGKPDAVIGQVESTEEFGHFCASVNKLPEQARRVFVLKKVYGFSQREIASELEISESTVEKHVALGTRRCAGYMSNYDAAQPQA